MARKGTGAGARGGSANLTWPQAQKLVAALGREAHLARRVETERRRLGWSQETLAREMTKAGCPLPQSAISKIEKPASGGRRAITVEEAIAFSKVFDLPLVELVLPEKAMGSSRVLTALAEGPDRLRDLIVAQQAYESILAGLARDLRADSSWVEDIEADLAEERESLEEAGLSLKDSMRTRFLLDVLEAAKA